MKKILFFFFIGLFSFSSFAADHIHLISVNGIAEAAVDPNMLVLQIESWGKAPTAKAAQEIQAEQFLKIKTLIEKFKIKKDDFKTENYSMQPDYVYDQKTQQNKIVGYRASHQMSVTFRNMDESGKLIDALTSASKNASNGGVSVSSISWDSDKKSTIENSVINEAVRNARAQAEVLAKAANVSIKAVHRILYNMPSAHQASSQNFNMKEAMMSSADSTELAVKKIKIRIEVQMEFEI